MPTKLADTRVELIPFERPSSTDSTDWREFHLYQYRRQHLKGARAKAHGADASKLAATWEELTIARTFHQRAGWNSPDEIRAALKTAATRARALEREYRKLIAYYDLRALEHKLVAEGHAKWLEEQSE